MRPPSAFAVGDYVRTTEELGDTPYANVTGVIREGIYSQHVNAQTGEPTDEWSWGYMVEFERGFPIFTSERFLRRARIDE